VAEKPMAAALRCGAAKVSRGAGEGRRHVAGANAWQEARIEAVITCA
jgi:hypothetical protein